MAEQLVTTCLNRPAGGKQPLDIHLLKDTRNLDLSWCLVLSRVSSPGPKLGEGEMGPPTSSMATWTVSTIAVQEQFTLGWTLAL